MELQSKFGLYYTLHDMGFGHVIRRQTDTQLPNGDIERTWETKGHKIPLAIEHFDKNGNEQWFKVFDQNTGKLVDDVKFGPDGRDANGHSWQ